MILPAPGIESTPITTDKLCVLVPLRHRLHTRDAVTPGELREEGFIMEKTQCALHLLEKAGFEPGKAKPRIRYFEEFQRKRELNT